MIRIVVVVDRLPAGFAELAADAAAEGVGNAARLAAEWATGAQRFAPPAALFAAIAAGAHGDELAGVGGVTPDPGPGTPAMRMRRLYVRPAWRRSGVGRLLALTMIEHGSAAAPLLTVGAGASAAAAPFWEAMGFARTRREGCTHELLVPRKAVEIIPPTSQRAELEPFQAAEGCTFRLPH